MKYGAVRKFYRYGLYISLLEIDWIDFKLHIPVSKACRSFSHPQSLLSPPKTYSFIPTAAIVAEDLADGTSPPVIILFNV